MDEFRVDIKHASRELTKRETVKVKDISAAIHFDTTVIDDKDEFIVSPESYVEMHVNNPKSQNPEYDVMSIIDNAGNVYVTSSNAFMTKFKQIFEDMAGEEYEIKVIKKPSKSYNGKFYLTCALV